MLDICRDFFTYLNDSQVLYCHWKSTIRLHKGLAGKTDLDLLVHRKDEQSFERALSTFGFKRIVSPAWKRYPGVEDYLGLDRTTAAFVHLHVHYNLVLGEKRLKVIHLDREDCVLQARRFIGMIPVPRPEVELLLAIIRFHLKFEPEEIALNHLKRTLRPARTPYPQAVWEELVFLLGQTTPETFRTVLREIRIPLSEELIMDFLDKLRRSEVTTSEIRSVRRHVMIRMRPFRTISPARYRARKALVSLRTLPFVPALRNKKVLPRAGRFIALVGADGSGKSTLVRDLESWLSWKLSVRTVYYGIPESTVNTFMRLIVRTASLAEKYLPWRPARHCFLHIARYVDAWRWIMVAWTRLHLSRSSLGSVSRGRVVIADRYPLALFNDMEQPMDGPRLQPQAANMPFLARLEKCMYDRIGLPDRIFVLKADFSVLRRRKDNLEERQHLEKSRAVNSIGPTECIVPINVDRPYEDVLMDLKRAIWSLLE
ncbi:MAG TPA: hypothetical protein PKO27_15955 [Deltaproteobacteria bacterium]|nr:hypothetical protein [Deltaproteobacteria bacterium]HPA08496.1 hypothetical protein [Methanoregulaceae archaeon]